MKIYSSCIGINYFKERDIIDFKVREYLVIYLVEVPKAVNWYYIYYCIDSPSLDQLIPSSLVMLFFIVYRI